MTPGVYENIPNRLYQSWDLPSVSFLNEMEINPFAAWWSKAHPNPMPKLPPYITEAALDIGTATHANVLEDGAIGEAVVVLPDLNYKVKDEKLQWIKLRDENPYKVWLRPECWSKVLRLSEAIKNHHEISQILSIPGKREISIVHDTTTATGRPVTVKARIDATLESKVYNALADLKTVREADDDSVEKSITHRNYNRQGGWYMQICKERDDLPDPEAFWFLFASTDEKKWPIMPQRCRAVELDLGDAAIGASRIRELLDDYLDYRESGDWPGYRSLETKGLKPWARKRAQNE